MGGRMRRLVLLASALVLVDTLFYSVVAPLLPHYRDELGVSEAAAGILAAAYPAGTLLGSIPGGLLAARAGARRTVLAALVGIAVSSLVFGFAQSILLLDLARFVQGFAGAFTWAGALTWLIGAAPPERRGELIGTALAAATAGSLLGPVAGTIAEAIGPEIVFSSVVVIAIGLALWALTMPAPPRAQTPQSLGEIARAARRGPVLAASWLVALPAAAFAAMAVVGALRLDDLGAGGVVVGATFLVGAVIEASLSPSIGRWSDRAGRFVPIRAGLLSGAVALILFTLPQNVALLGLAMVAVTVTLALFWGPAIALLADATEAAGLHLAIGFAFVNLAWAAGQVIGSAAGGALAEHAGDAVAPLVVAALALVTLAMLVRARRPATV
jgi:predicted MFS family arabinose efflux permease